MSNSNFPENLDIHPLVASETNEAFGFNAQKEAIIKYGIAGRVWSVQSPGRSAEDNKTSAGRPRIS